MRKAVKVPSKRSLLFWKVFQILFWIVGIALLLIMLVKPTLGVTLFWDILIPVAPALLVVATGAWRNICPLSTTSLLADKFGLSKKKKLTFSQRTVLNLVGVITLFLIIPLRHILFNKDGQATAVIIMGLSAVAFLSGFIFDRKSGWCAGLCPVHPVEKLYGSRVAVTLPNAHCNECVRCSFPCPDSTPNLMPVAPEKSDTSKAVELLLAGAFPGYVWGWFQVPDYTSITGWLHLGAAYAYPILGGFVTLSVYILLKQITRKHIKHRKLLISLFAAAAISCYYWFRLPLLLGFGTFKGDGMLVDLSGSLPAWSMSIVNITTTAFFLWWMVIRTKAKRSWAVRPKYADK